MTTAAQATTAILEEILVHGAESDLEGVEFQDAVFAMNNYMFELAADGVNLGYTEVVDLGDLITINNGAINGMIKNVAQEMINQFGAVVASGELARQAARGLKIMTKIAVTIPAQVFPDTLPIGSGNECDTNIHFYGDEGDFIATEQGNFIAPEDNTEVV